jgi:hypothetical protein
VQIPHCLNCFYLEINDGVEKSRGFLIIFKVNCIYLFIIFLTACSVANFKQLLWSKYCYMLGFLGNMTSALCCVTMGLFRFLSNATIKTGVTMDMAW